MITRAKFRCSTVEQTSNQPYERKLYPAGGGEPVAELTWPRKYRFVAVTDDSTPENQQYAQYTPSGELTIQVDNPNVTFEPGTAYYLDFTPVEAVDENGANA